MSGSHRQAGQATLEFGLSALVLILILLGLIDLGRAFYFGVGIQGAVREGARQASWFDPDSGANPDLYDGAIKAAVDAVLSNSGLPASTLANPGMTCPTPADGNAGYNPPYADSTYPTSLDEPRLFICYAATPGLDLAVAPADNGYRGQDVNVIVLMSFGLATGFMNGVLGNSVHMAANTHMTIGGY